MVLFMYVIIVTREFRYSEHFLFCYLFSFIQLCVSIHLAVILIFMSVNVKVTTACALIVPVTIH